MRPQRGDDLPVEPDDEFAVRHVSLLATGVRPIEKQQLISDNGMEHLISVSPCLVLNELDRGMVAAVRTTEKNIVYAESAVATTMSDKRHNEITPTQIAKKFNIGQETTQRTLTMTTQQGIRTAIYPITRRYRVDLLQLNRRWLPGTWYTNTLSQR